MQKDQVPAPLVFAAILGVVVVFVCLCTDKQTFMEQDASLSQRLEAGFANRTTDWSKLTPSQKSHLAAFAGGSAPELRGYRGAASRPANR